MNFIIHLSTPTIVGAKVLLLTLLRLSLAISDKMLHSCVKLCISSEPAVLETLEPVT